MRKILFILLINMMFIWGTIRDGMAQAPDIEVSLIVTKTIYDITTITATGEVEPLEMALRIKNKGEDLRVNHPFPGEKLYLHLTFTNQDNFEIKGNLNEVPVPAPIIIDDVQMDRIVIWPAGSVITIPFAVDNDDDTNLYNYYELFKGIWTVSFTKSIRLYQKENDVPRYGLLYSPIADASVLELNITGQNGFYIVADEDDDGYSWPIASSPPADDTFPLIADCNDADANEHPGQTWYADLDGDLFSDGTTLIQCTRPLADYYVDTELTAISGDCDDTNSAINPGATEVCDNQDNNCDSVIDEGFDLDEDGFTTCALPVADCDDDDPLINPGMTELPGNEIDDDCNPDTLDVEDVCADLDNIGRPSVINMVYMGSGTLPDTVYIIANDRSNWDHSGAFTYFAGVVEKFDNHEFPDRINNMEVDIDGRLSDAGRLSGGLFVHIFNGSSVPVAGVSSSDQQVSFHPSCSDPLFTGDQYGSLLLFDWISEGGGP